MNVGNLIKGIEGEKLIDRILTREYGSKYLIKNLVISNTQIDFILIQSNGIHVLEVKNFKYDIYGDTKDTLWQVDQGNRIKTMYNPLKQNKKHCTILSNLLLDNIDKIPVYNLVVFVGEATINVKSEYLANHHSMIDKINEVPFKYLTDEERENVKELILTKKGSSYEHATRVLEYCKK